MLKPFCHFIATFLFLLLTLSLHAAEVVKYNEGDDGKYLAIAKDDTHEVVLNYSLCFFRKKQSVGCGLVIRISDKGYIVAMDKVTPGIKLSPGDKLEVRKMARSTASKSNKLEIIATRYETERLYKSLVGGFNIISPYVRFEQMLLSWLNLGIMPTYLLSQSAGNVTLNGPGLLVTATVHPMEPMEQLLEADHLQQELGLQLLMSFQKKIS
jgi:hypothetical protein